MSKASYIQAPQPETLHPAQPLIGLPNFLCPAELRKQFREESAYLRHALPYPVQQIKRRQVTAIKNLVNFKLSQEQLR